MATIPTEKALTEFRERAAALYTELVLRDVAIADLEEKLAAAEKDNAELRAQLALPSAG
jgi:hypothetical protein